MERSSIERAVAVHCAAVLLGQKPAATVCVPALDKGSLTALSRSLRGYGARVLPLRWRSGRVLLMLFAPDRLAARLRQGNVAAALAERGYEPGGLGAFLQRLQARCQGGDEFPHEIGFFLGYPYEDVCGFWRHGGRNYKCAGLWKVYGDVEEAQRMFAECRDCRQALEAHLNDGGTLADYPLEAATYAEREA